MLTKSKSTTLCWHVVLKVNQSRIGMLPMSGHKKNGHLDPDLSGIL